MILSLIGVPNNCEAHRMGTPSHKTISAELYKFFNHDLQRLQNCLDERNKLVVEVVNRACKRAGITSKDLTHVMYINDPRPGAIEIISKPLGIPISHTNSEYAKNYGHMGAADQLISLGLHSQHKKTVPGDIVALCGISTGMQWCCTLIQV